VFPKQIRSQDFAIRLVICLLLGLLLLLAGYFLSSSSSVYPYRPVLPVIVYLFAAALTAYALIFVLVPRLRDMGASPYWSLLLFVPVVNAVLFIKLAVTPSDQSALLYWQALREQPNARPISSGKVSDEVPRLTRRPTSVTVIGWLLIVGGIASVARIPFYLNNSVLTEALARSPLPASLFHFLFVVYPPLQITCGIGMLKARNWARYLYVVLGAAVIILLMTIVPPLLGLIPAAGYALVLFLLFRPKVGGYFSERGLAST